VERLRAQRSEVEQAILDGVRERVPDSIADGDLTLMQGLPRAVGAIVEYSIATLETGGPQSGTLPQAAAEQARRAARTGVGLKTVLRRYIAGYAVLERFLLKEITAADLAEVERITLWQSVSDAQGSLLDRLLDAIADEYQLELESVTGSREQRRAELVHELLSGTDVSSEALGYDLGASHLGLIASGERAEEAVRRLAVGLNRELLSVSSGQQTVSAWLGGRSEFAASELERVLSSDAFASVLVALGEPAVGTSGFRLTHRQATGAREIARHGDRAVTRYSDMPLVALALQDEASARWLIDTYMRPLDSGRGDGATLRRTLSGYFAVGYNTASAAAALGIGRSTMRERLTRIERRLGCTISDRHAELSTALRLEELTAPISAWSLPRADD
jgi:hypothetical protein